MRIIKIISRAGGSQLLMPLWVFWMLLGCCWFAAEFLLLLLLPIAMPILGHHRNPRLGVIGAHVQQRREGERQTERQRDREGGEVKIFLAHILSFFFFVFLSLSLSLSRSLFILLFLHFSKLGDKMGVGVSVIWSFLCWLCGNFIDSIMTFSQVHLLADWHRNWDNRKNHKAHFP